MNRRLGRWRTALLVAVLALSAGCAALGKPQLDPTDPVNVIYLTRSGVAQSADTVAVAVDAGLVSPTDGRDLQKKLARATLALALAELAVQNGKGDDQGNIEVAIALLEAVRTDPRFRAPAIVTVEPAP